MTTATMTWRGCDYEVVGGMDGDSGSFAGADAASCIIRRVDGRQMRGVRMLSGMVQVGVSRGLRLAAIRALRSAVAAEVQS